MRLPQNTVAPTALACIALLVIVPIALLLVVVVRFAKSGVNPLDFIAAMMTPAAAADLDDARSKGWRGVLDAVAHARLF
jgi:hypothetical protein